MLQSRFSRPLLFYLSPGDSPEIVATWNPVEIRERVADLSCLYLITASGTTSERKRAIRCLADSLGTREHGLDLLDSLAVNPHACRVGDIRVDIYRGRNLSEVS